MTYFLTDGKATYWGKMALACSQNKVMQYVKAAQYIKTLLSSLQYQHPIGLPGPTHLACPCIHVLQANISGQPDRVSLVLMPTPGIDGSDDKREVRRYNHCNIKQ